MGGGGATSRSASHVTGKTSNKSENPVRFVSGFLGEKKVGKPTSIAVRLITIRDVRRKRGPRDVTRVFHLRETVAHRHLPAVRDRVRGSRAHSARVRVRFGNDETGFPHGGEKFYRLFEEDPVFFPRRS